MARKLGSHIDPIYNLKPEYAKGYKWATLDWHPDPEAELKAVVRLYSAGRRAG